MDSRNLGSASSIEIPKLLNSLNRYPLPTPKSSRPSDNKSSVAACSANKTGLCHGRVITAVPRRMLDVNAER